MELLNWNVHNYMIRKKLWKKFKISKIDQYNLSAVDGSLFIYLAVTLASAASACAASKALSFSSKFLTCTSRSATFSSDFWARCSVALKKIQFIKIY